MMEYFHLGKPKHQDHLEKAEEPVLTEEDEAFLHRIATEGNPPPLPDRPQDLPVAGETRGNDAQIALLDAAQDVPLPDTPAEETNRSLGDNEHNKGKEKVTTKQSKPLFKWSFHRRDSRDSKRRDKETAATDLMSAAEGLKERDHSHLSEDGIASDHETKKEEEELTSVLDQLNLAAINNRAFSISKESQDLLRKFTLVLKDLVNGVPTAYDDLESLLTNSEHQLQRSYKHLPAFLQKLIESLPSKMTESIAPELLAAAAERPGLHSAKNGEPAGKAASKFKVPSLKDLVTKPGAVAGMLRAIMNFLKLRFPAFLGMNVLYSLALFVLLFVFWYCHKRGREVRLEKERLLTEAEIAALNNEPTSSCETATSPPATTRAPEGASINEVQAGMQPSQAQEGSAPYAPGGSLAKELAREKAEEAEAAKAKETNEEGEVAEKEKAPAGKEMEEKSMKPSEVIPAKAT